MTLTRRTAEEPRNPPLFEVVRSGRGSAVGLRRGGPSQDQLHRVLEMLVLPLALRRALLARPWSGAR